MGGNACDITPFCEDKLRSCDLSNNKYYAIADALIDKIFFLVMLITARCFLPEDIVIINSTSSQLTYICNCSPSMMIVKTAVCVGNGTWLPQILCGGDVCTSTDDGKVAGGQ